MYFWTWDTEEVLDMILWMRAFNASGRGRVQFTGFDMQTPTVAMEIVRAFVDPIRSAVRDGDRCGRTTRYAPWAPVELRCGDEYVPRRA